MKQGDLCKIKQKAFEDMRKNGAGISFCPVVDGKIAVDTAVRPAPGEPNVARTCKVLTHEEVFIFIKELALTDNTTCFITERTRFVDFVTASEVMMVSFRLTGAEKFSFNKALSIIGEQNRIINGSVYMNSEGKLIWVSCYDQENFEKVEI